MEYSYRFSSADGKHAERRTNAAFIKAILALAAAGLAFSGILFPEEISGVLSKLGFGGEMSHTAAVLGEAVGGESDFDETITEVFGVSGGEPAEESGGEVLGVPSIYDIPDTYTETDTETLIPTDGADYNEAAVAAFKETQSKYEKYGVPKNVSYDMPEIAADMICPVMGSVSSHFGYRVHPNDGVVRFHYGTDIAASEGTEIIAAADGKVKTVGNSSSYGKYIMIECDGATYMYAHCSKIIASEGDTVTKGDTVALVGKTGNATGACVHFEVIVDGIYVNPEYYISWT